MATCMQYVTMIICQDSTCITVGYYIIVEITSGVTLVYNPPPLFNFAPLFIAAINMTDFLTIRKISTGDCVRPFFRNKVYEQLLTYFVNGSAPRKT